MACGKSLHHHTSVLAQALGVGVEECVELVQLLEVGDGAGVEHRALDFDRRGRLEGRGGGGHRVGGTEDALDLSSQAPYPGDDHRVGQALLAAAMTLQRQGLRQPGSLRQPAAPRGIDEREVAVTHG